MKQSILIGNSNFSSIRENNYFYIDKTNFIKEWWENAHIDTLLMRPPNFGKTLNLSMIDSFFSCKYANRSDLFEGLSIWKYEKYRELQGSYPVIYLSFEDVKANTFSDAKKYIMQKSIEVCNSFRFIAESKDFNYFSDCEFSDINATHLLNKLSFHLYHYYGKKVIILLDDFDAPIREAYWHGYWYEMVYFMSSLFLSTFKVNEYLECSLITGSTGRGFGSPLCDVNHLSIITTSSKMYANYFGFTEDEVFKALDTWSLLNRKEEVKEWYGGFTFGECNDSIYNPLSVVNFLNSGELKIYRIDPTLDHLVGKLLREIYYKDEINSLLEKEIISTELDEEIIFNPNESSLWSFLFAFGYLSMIDSYYKEDWTEIYRLKIPNQETLLLLKSML